MTTPRANLLLAWAVTRLVAGAVFAALCATAHKEPRPAGGARGGATPQFGASSMFGGADVSADSVLRAASTIYEGETLRPKP